MKQLPYDPTKVKMTCIHVLRRQAKPEYNKEDDGYVCTRCRNLLAKKGIKSVEKFTVFVHIECLEKAIEKK